MARRPPKRNNQQSAIYGRPSAWEENAPSGMADANLENEALERDTQEKNWANQLRRSQQQEQNDQSQNQAEPQQPSPAPQSGSKKTSGKKPQPTTKKMDALMKKIQIALFALFLICLATILPMFTPLPFMLLAAIGAIFGYRKIVKGAEIVQSGGKK